MQAIPVSLLSKNSSKSEDESMVWGVGDDQNGNFLTSMCVNFRLRD